MLLYISLYIFFIFWIYITVSYYHVTLFIIFCWNARIYSIQFCFSILFSHIFWLKQCPLPRPVTSTVYPPFHLTWSFSYNITNNIRYSTTSYIFFISCSIINIIAFLFHSMIPFVIKHSC